MNHPHATLSDNRLPVVIDTREQFPWGFDAERVVTSRAALPAGDYSLVGYESSGGVALERKSLEDFVNTLTRERARFFREMSALGDRSLRGVIVEADIREVVARRYRGEINPDSLLGFVAAIEVDYGVSVHFLSNRQIAARHALRLMTRWWARRGEGGGGGTMANSPARTAARISL